MDVVSPERCVDGVVDRISVLLHTHAYGVYHSQGYRQWLLPVLDACGPDFMGPKRTYFVMPNLDQNSQHCYLFSRLFFEAHMRVL